MAAEFLFVNHNFQPDSSAFEYIKIVQKTLTMEHILSQGWFKELCPQEHQDNT